MMKRAIILHGKPSKEGYYSTDRDSESNSHWLPWLQHQLCVRDVLAQTPEMPAPYAPDYERWREEFERQAIDEDTILVGHSCGGGFLTRWLSEASVQIDKLVLVAPWLDREHDYEDLFQFELDENLAKKTKHGIDVLYSTNDGPQMQSTLAFLRERLPDARYHEFVDYGHFCLRDMNTREFPELLTICIDE